MKRVFTIILTLAIVLSLCACGGSSTEETQGNSVAGFQIGFARESIMPKTPVGMPGFANAEHRISTGYTDILYASCLAFSEGEDTVLMYSVDTIYMDAATTQKLREQISAKTGVPQGNIMISGTHTHTGPYYSSEPYYTDVFLPAFIKAAEDAIADRASATMYGTKTLVEGISFVRHYISRDGKYLDSGEASQNPALLAGHARETDPEMILVKIDREGDKKDITLINWQCHPCFSYESTTLLSADFIASLRTDVETQTGTEVIYFSGAGGDLGGGTKMPNEPAINDVNQFGSFLAEKAVAALGGTLTKIEGSGVKIANEQFEYATNRAGIERLEDAQKVKDFAEQKGSYESAEVNNYAKELGFASARECNTIVSNAQRPEKEAFEINALYLGGLAFVTAPYEMYATNGQFIKENSPFEYTVVATQANGYLSYFPVKEAYEGGVEIYEIAIAKFVSGIAEDTANRFVELLKGLQ